MIFLFRCRVRHLLLAKEIDMTEVASLLNFEVNFVTEIWQTKSCQALGQKVDFDDLLSFLEDCISLLNINRPDNSSYPSHEWTRLLLEESHINIHGLINLSVELDFHLARQFINECFEIFLFSVVIILDCGN